MAQATEVKTIAVIGTGDVGFALSRGFLRDGYKVVMGTRKVDESIEKATVEKLKTKGSCKDEMALVEKHIGHFSLTTQQKAAHQGEIVVLAVNWSAVEAVCKELHDILKGKVVLDVNNPLNFEGGKLQGLLPLKDSKGNQRSGGEVVQELLPHSKVVKCFNMVPHALMTDGTRFFKTKPLMYISGNDEHANKWTLELLHKWNFDGHILGDIKTSHYSEVGCILWVFHLAENGFKNSQHAFVLSKTW